MTPSGTDHDQRLVDEARGFVGAPPVGARGAREPVNTAMINHWCDALGDRNAAYTDAADSTRHGGVIAPPAMLGTWTMDGSSGAASVWEDRGEAAAAAAKGPRDEVLRRLEEAGYTAVVATNYEQTYLRPLRPGDVLSETLTVEELSEQKTTALGTGFFVTVRHDYRDADDELVGVARMRLLKFAPAQRGDPSADGNNGDPATEARKAPAARARPRPPVNRDTAFFWEGVKAGELRLQRCTGCGRLRHPPRPMCGLCRSTGWTTVVSSGRGEVYSFVVHHHPPLPGIELPLVVVLVALEEDVRFVSSLTGAGPDDVRIGMPVEAVFEQVDDDLVLPLFRPAGVAAGAEAVAEPAP